MDIAYLKQLRERVLRVLKEEFPTLLQLVKKGDKEGFKRQFINSYPVLEEKMPIDEIVNAPDPENQGKPMSKRGFLGWMGKAALAGAVYSLVGNPLSAFGQQLLRLYDHNTRRLLSLHRPNHRERFCHCYSKRRQGIYAVLQMNSWFFPIILKTAFPK